ncbi:hypothetical protein MMC24_000254 [Lignoscripta atroalba]|nr:hypothetical protein [Lignoscripta atroalba]
MHRQAFVAAVAAIVSAAGVHGQTTINPLNEFIGMAGSAAAVASSAAAKETRSSSTTSASPTSATAAATSSAAAAVAPASSGLTSRNRLIIIIVCIIVGVLLLLLIAGCLYCCLARRRRQKRATTPVPDDEMNTWRRPSNPGRQYTPVSGPVQTSGLTQHPTVPDMTMVDRRPMEEHPALRHENPFVPIPPVPRKAVNSRPDLTGGTIPGDDAYVMQPRNYLRKSRSQSHSSSGNDLDDKYIEAGATGGLAAGAPVLPTQVGSNRPATPLRFDGVSRPHDGAPDYTIPVGQKHDRIYQPGETGDLQPYSYIGQPYQENHVQILQTGLTGLPPAEMRQSLENRESHHSREPNRQRYSTPPAVPSRSPRRSPFRDSTYVSNSSNETESTSGSGSGESWRTSQMGVVPPTTPWEHGQASRIRSNSSPRQSMQAPPPAPWEDRERRHSNSPKGRGESRSPRPSLSGTPTRQGQNGTPRRLRFSDFQTEHEHEPWHEHRHSQGVGEAM